MTFGETYQYQRCDSMGFQFPHTPCTSKWRPIYVQAGMSELSVRSKCRVRGFLFPRSYPHWISTTSGKSVLILGATGATGQFLLQRLLECPAYSRVGEYGRRVTSLDLIVVGQEKLIQKVIDFEDLSTSGIKEGRWDVVLITCAFSWHIL